MEELLEEYILSHIDEEGEYLKRLNRDTHVNLLRPRMLSGHLQGRILKMLCRMIRPDKILELGTFTGYSALCMAEGLNPGGVLHTIEMDDELEDFTRPYLEQSPYKENIRFHIGDAIKVVPTLDETFDLVFIDADKRHYCEYYDLVFDKVRPGGFILADNTLWDGKIIDPQARDGQTVGIRKFNDLIASDTRVEKVIIPLVIILVIVGVIAGVFFYVKNKVRKFSQDLFGTDSLVEGWKKQEEELSVTPCSVSGMTRLLEPQIQRDFPEFNWVQFKNKAEDALKLSLMAISAHSIGRAESLSEALKEEVAARIEQNQTAGVNEVYERIRVHQTEIARYEKQKGKCIITLQSAVEHIHYKEKDGKLISGKKDLLEQTKYNMELMYIQDESKVSADKGVGLTCPHCGAPVTSLGAKYCEFCGSEVIPINMQVWSLQHFYEVTYQKV